ncbi:MAG: BrnT family toxin [Polyangiaceae bacterium]
MLHFAWDPRKARSNWQKHGVRFEEARDVFADPLSLTEFDGQYGSEERYFTIGRTSRARLLVVVHNDHGETIRIISARQATASERRDYENGETR